MDTQMKDRELLIRDKYDGNEDADLTEDLARLASGEPLAYVIGWIPFLGLRISLDSRPLIPRPETEWWTEQLATMLDTRALRVLDLCAGSGAIGLALLHACPHLHVSFAELSPAHTAQIETNLTQNTLDASRAVIRSGDLCAPYAGERFDLIATNPPYIPAGRTLDTSVTSFEPTEALCAGADGLDLIRRIAHEAPQHMNTGGELWMECDTENIHQAAELLTQGGARKVIIRTDLYGRERLVLAYY